MHNYSRIFMEQKNYETIEKFLCEKFSEELEINIDEVDIEKAFSEYGLSSIATMQISGDLEDFLGKKINPIILFEYYTIKKLATFLSKS